MEETLTQEKTNLFSVSSPEELRNRVAAMGAERRELVRFVSLVLCGSDVVVRPFQLSGFPWGQIASQLQSKAVEMLSLPADDIELDFQIFESTPEKKGGVFVAMPKSKLKEYLRICDENGFVPLKITMRLLAVIESFMQEQDKAPEHFGFLDLSRENQIGFAAFDGRQWLLREIRYENPDEAIHEVVQSLRSFRAKSSIKDRGNLYVAGQASFKKNLIEQVRQGFAAEVKESPDVGVETPTDLNLCFFDLNLARYYTFSPRRRRQLLLAINIVLGLCAVLFVVFGAGIISNGQMIKKLSWSESDRNFQAAEIAGARRQRLSEDLKKL